MAYNNFTQDFRNTFCDSTAKGTFELSQQKSIYLAKIAKTSETKMSIKT